MTKLYAGFDGGKLPWNGLDLIVANNHEPHTAMARHYLNAVDSGAQGFRDCLPWDRCVRSRIETARFATRHPVIWDMVHYNMPPDPIDHAIKCGDSIGPGGWAITVNEPTIHAEFNGEDGSWRTVETAIAMMRATPELNHAACDALCTLDENRWWAMDRMVETGLVKLVGINYYPHSADVPLARIIKEVKTRYPGVKVAITETGWHVGHPALGDADVRRSWLDFVMSLAAMEELEFVCWYPWLDAPDWNDPSNPKWNCGFPA